MFKGRKKAVRRPSLDSKRSPTKKSKPSPTKRSNVRTRSSSKSTEDANREVEKFEDVDGRYRKYKACEKSL